MKYIGVVECISSGRMYIADITSLGYRPLVINLNMNDEFLLNYRRMLREDLEGKADFIDEGDDFDEFIGRLKEYDIQAVFPGSERGVRAADLINQALGLKGNDPDTTYLRCTKAGMDEALGKAGIRRIATHFVEAEEDIGRFWKDHDIAKCVLKFSEAAGTVGLKICDSVEDQIDHYRAMQEMDVAHKEVLIQEYIDGTEYVVNTVSCNGKHMVTDIWVYSKVRQEDGTLAYNYQKLIKDLEPGHTQMLRYVDKVLSAVDMKWGICHTEIKIDHKGPVLIETNARPMGLAMTNAYYEEVLGFTPTSISLDLFFHPSRFDALSRRMYSPRKYALMKNLIIPEDIIANLNPTFILSRMISSSRETLFFGKEGIQRFFRTVDLHTSPLVIKMANEDYGQLMRDYQIIRLAESYYFHIYYSLGGDLPGVEPRTDLEGLIADLGINGRILLVTDDGEFVLEQGRKEKVKSWTIYDCAIYATCGQMSKEERYVSIFKTMHSIRSGGLFIAAPESYEAFEDGPVIMDFLMNICSIKILTPLRVSQPLIYGVKK